MGLVGGQLKTSIYLSSLSFLSRSFFLSFLFFFHINFGPAGPLKKERERERELGGVDSSFVF